MMDDGCSIQRRLAAILAVDISGYSRLMGEDEARVPFESGRRMAAAIPGARFVALQGRNHIFLESEPAFGQFLEQTRAFLAT